MDGIICLASWSFPEEHKNLANSWTFIAHRIGNPMFYWLLPYSGIPITRTSIQAVSSDDLNTEFFKIRLTEFDAKIAVKLKS